MEESEVEGKLLEVKLAANVVLALRFEDEVVEKGPMTTVAVAVAVEDMVSSFRVYSSPIPADYCCYWVSFPRCLMNEICESQKLFWSKSNIPRVHLVVDPCPLKFFHFISLIFFGQTFR